MSLGEVAGLAVLAGLCGVTAGVILAAVIGARYSRRAGRHMRRIDAYAKWLGAHLTATRASLSFVAAFRALADARSDSVYFELRTTEAQRARAYWCDAMQRLDAAEAALIVLAATELGDNTRAWFFRIRPDALRRAINGPEENIEELARHLHSADRAAIDFTRSATLERKASAKRGGLGDMLVHAVTRLQTIVDRWGDLH